MEIKQNHKRSYRNIKSFALTATAAAVLALSAGQVSASNPCPLVIDPAHPVVGICDVTTASVTVANGGLVEGIGMISTTASFINVASDGVISNTVGETAQGIFLRASTLSGSISNSGSISATSTTRSNPVAVGIEVYSGSAVTGGISNSGSIHATAHADEIAIAVGIEVDKNGAVSSGISNSGSINATAQGTISANAAGIGVYNTSTISGGISNSGVINATANGIGKNTKYAEGIEIYGHSLVSGGIFNSGTINATANGTSNQNAAGVGVYNTSIVNGGISNSGTINATANGTSGGYVASIEVFKHSTVNQGILNSRLISSTANKANAHAAGIGIFSTSTVNGGISNTGSINASASGLKGAAAGIEISSQSTVSSGISNSGSINASASGVNGVAVGIWVASGSTVEGGIVNSGIIQGDNFAVRVCDDSTVDNLDITGKSARMIGKVYAINTNVNITSKAEFTSEGTFNVQNFNIGSSAVFNVTNSANTITTAGAGKVDNSGTMSIAEGIKQTIIGAYTQEANGVLQIGAQNTESYGQLMTSGTADLSANGRIDVKLQPGASFHSGDVLSDVLVSGGLTPTNGYTVTDNSFIWNFTAQTHSLSTFSVNNVNALDLIISINPTAYSACSGTYCAGAASVIIGQVADGNAAFNPFTALLTEQAFITAASQATPELTNENFQVTQLVTRAVVDALPMWASVRGQSAGDAMLSQPGKVWLKPYGAYMSQNQRTTVNGYNATAYGLVGGGDVRLSNDWMLGGALAIGTDNVDGKSVLSGQSIDSDDYQGIIYSTKLLAHNTYLAGQGLLGYGHNDTKRALPLFGSTATGSYGSWFTNWNAELGWNYAVNERLLLIPAVNASYLYINQAAYTESGSPMALNVQSNNNSSLVLGADANAAYQAATLKDQHNVILTAHAGVAYDVLNNQPNTTATFVAGGPSFSTYGIQYNGAVFRGGVGLNIINPIKPLSFNLNYDLQAGNNGYNGVYSATLKYKV